MQLLNHPLLPLAALLLAASELAAASFMLNESDRARIESALPAKAPAQPLKPRRLLIFTRNVGYGGHPSMAYANEAFTLMGRKTGAFETEVSDDPNVFQRSSLTNLDAVFFNNTVGNCFTNADLRRNLVEFVLRGGGLLGVHGTTVAFMNWPGAIEDWPEFGFLIGARGANHKDSDERVWLKLDDPESPLLQCFGGRGFEYADEFFRPQGTYSRDRVRVLLTIDTTKTDPNKGQARGNCYRADNDYAVAWIRSYGRGRVFYCTIAHNPYVFRDEKMLRFYLAAAQFALGDLACPTTPSARVSPAVRAQEKLGWRLALESGPPPSASLSALARRAVDLGLPYAGASSAQPVGGDLTKPFDPRLTDADLERARLACETPGVRMLTLAIAEPLDDEDAAARWFEFGCKTGVEVFILNRLPRDLAPLEKLSAATGIRVAFQANDPAAASALAHACAGRGRQIGVCLDLSRGAGSAWQPRPLIHAVRGRLFALRLPDPAAAPAGLTETLLTEVQRAGDAPVFLIDSGRGAQVAHSIEFFNATALKLSTRSAASNRPAALAR